MTFWKIKLQITRSLTNRRKTWIRDQSSEGSYMSQNPEFGELLKKKEESESKLSPEPLTISWRKQMQNWGVQKLYQGQAKVKVEEWKASAKRINMKNPEYQRYDYSLHNLLELLIEMLVQIRNWFTQKHLLNAHAAPSYEFSDQWKLHNLEHSLFPREDLVIKSLDNVNT